MNPNISMSPLKIITKHFKLQWNVFNHLCIITRISTQRYHFCYMPKINLNYIPEFPDVIFNLQPFGTSKTWLPCVRPRKQKKMFSTSLQWNEVQTIILIQDKNVFKVHLEAWTLHWYASPSNLLAPHRIQTCPFLLEWNKT